MVVCSASCCRLHYFAPIILSSTVNWPYVQLLCNDTMNVATDMDRVHWAAIQLLAPRGRMTRASGAMAAHHKQPVGDVLAPATITLWHLADDRCSLAFWPRSWRNSSGVKSTMKCISRLDPEITFRLNKVPRPPMFCPFSHSNGHKRCCHHMARTLHKASWPSGYLIKCPTLLWYLP